MVSSPLTIRNLRFEYRNCSIGAIAGRRTDTRRSRRFIVARDPKRAGMVMREE
jgi:hypothetical protein